MALDYRTVVRKLMDSARNYTDKGDEQVAQSYAEKAAELATKHGVEDALAESHHGSGKPNIILKRINVSNPYPKHRITLISVIGRHHNCKVLKSGRNGAEIFGDARDVERVVFIYRLISTHMLDAVSKCRPELPVDVYAKHGYFKKDGLTPAETKSFRVSWVIGYINGISARMAAAYTQAVEEAKETNPGAALVLADRRALADKLVTETYGKVGKTAPSKVRNARAYQQGKAASTTADLGQTRLGGERKALAG